ncbi:transcription initiation factor TFIID subunit 14 [Trichomonascus vanleenenianus]|uniref:transcription initiation factor TFIID subunit 14 n=1 Tax=Trichomonascus vanleenenianus TaxID=2268995 RepID=UPI003EC9AF4C
MPEQVQRTVKVITKQHILEDVPAVEGFPTRQWSIQIALVGANGEDMPANIFDKVTYKLHQTFANPVRSFKKPPFLIEEQGWGEFDLGIVLHLADRGGDRTLSHDLNFSQNEYIVTHNISIPTNRPALARLLTESGPVPGYNAPGASGVQELGDKRKGDEGEGKLKKKPKTVQKADIDLESLADKLQKLGEDDLLGVVQMVTDNKTDEMYIKNDADEGEFHMDLYTLPDSLLRSLWDYCKKRVPA